MPVPRGKQPKFGNKTHLPNSEMKNKRQRLANMRTHKCIMWNDWIRKGTVATHVRVGNASLDAARFALRGPRCMICVA